MVQKWRGLAAPDQSQFDTNPHRGYDFRDKAKEIEPAGTGIVGSNDEAELEVHLRYGGLIIAGVGGHPYVDWQRRAYPQLVSKHGKLCDPGTLNGPYHAVVLTQWVSGSYLLLDPWFPATHQPLVVAAEDFSKFFNGWVIYVFRE